MESSAAGRLKEDGFTVVLPLVEESYVSRGCRHERITPLFPTYILLMVTNGWAEVNRTFGVTRVLMSAGEPARLREEVVGDIILRMDERGLVELPPLPDPFLHGQKLRVREGVFSGQHVIFDSMKSGPERCLALLSMLGKSRLVSFRSDQLEAA